MTVPNNDSLQELLFYLQPNRQDNSHMTEPSVLLGLMHAEGGIGYMPNGIEGSQAVTPQYRVDELGETIRRILQRDGY